MDTGNACRDRGNGRWMSKNRHRKGGNKFRDTGNVLLDTGNALRDRENDRRDTGSERRDTRNARWNRGNDLRDNRNGRSDTESERRERGSVRSNRESGRRDTGIGLWGSGWGGCRPGVGARDKIPGVRGEGGFAGNEPALRAAAATRGSGGGVPDDFGRIKSGASRLCLA